MEGAKKKSLCVLTVIPMAPEADLGRAKTSSRTSSGSVSLMMEGGEKRRLESPARDLLWGHTGTGGQRTHRHRRSEPSLTLSARGDSTKNNKRRMKRARSICANVILQENAASTPRSKPCFLAPFLQTLPQLVTLLKERSFSPHICLPNRPYKSHNV